MSFLIYMDKIVKEKVRDKMSEIVNDFVNKIVNINDATRGYIDEF